MSQQGSDYLRALYQEWSGRLAANPAMTIADLRDLFDAWSKPAFEAEGVSYKSDTIGGVPAIWAFPAGCDRTKVLLYTHGGGFAVGSADSHRKLAGHLAKALGVTAAVLDYRRAPENPFPAQIEDAAAVYKALLADGFKPENMGTAGDSAGGNLAVSSVLKFRGLGLPLPAFVIAFSPWVDMELKGGTLAGNAATDALVSRALLEGMIGMFLGANSANATNPLANPLYADFKGFPPLYIAAGSVETLLDDSIRLHGRAKADGVKSALSIVEGMQHVFPCLAGRAPEADREIAKIAEWHRAL